MELTLKELAKQLGAELIGSGAGVIRSVGPVASAELTTLTFFTSDKHLVELKKSRAGAVIVGKPVDGLSIPQLVVGNVNAALIEALKIFAPKLKPPAPGVDPTAKLGQRVRIGKGASVGAYVAIDDGVEIGDDTIIAGGCKIGENTKIGRASRLDCNVVVYHNCIIGNNVVIQANTTVGSTGFGYAFIDGAHRLIPHNGVVVIEDFVEIGANCCVDRAKFGETRIGAGTKIDNLVQIAHNVIIGKCCLIVAQVGISGSCKLGDGVVLGGQVGLADNIELGDGVMVAAQGGVIANIQAGKQVVGAPAVDRKEAFRIIAATLRLPKLLEQFRQLCARVDKLEEISPPSTQRPQREK
jgi:UDP-3-O-[3-hydroxymyristoyl] glucosamine N-acyltransferase